MQPETLSFACLLRCRVAETAVLGGFVAKRPSENAFTGFQTAYSHPAAAWRKKTCRRGGRFGLGVSALRFAGGQFFFDAGGFAGEAAQVV